MTATNKTILVTGGAGYVGSHSCKLLAQAGYLPVTFDNLLYGNKWAVKWGPIEKGNLLDKQHILRVMQKYSPEAVIHLAAYAYVGESIKKPGKYYENNVMGTLNLLESMLKTGVVKLVFSSTCATYGIPKQIPIPEDHQQVPINPYGASKLMVEKILEDYEKAHGIRSVVLRYFNAAGADPECEIGEDHTPETHLIPLIFDAALGRKEYISIFGDDYDTPDGTCIRDYIHIVDLANAHILALEYLESKGESLRLNLGNGQGYSVLETVEYAEKETKRPINIKIAARRPGDSPRLVGDSSRAKKILGWEPKYWALDMILRHAWLWHLKQFGSS